MTKKRSFGSVRKLGSSRYQASYWSNGARHVAETTFRTKADADGFLDTVSADRHRGMWCDPQAGEMLVSELADSWMASNPTKRPTTRATDDIAIRVHILPALGELPIRKVTPPQIHALVGGWSERAQPRTVRRQYATLRAMFAYAVECDWLARTPCRAVKLPAVTSTRRQKLSPDQVEAIAEATLEPYRVMVWLGALMGLRWSEVAGLRIGRIDVLRRSLTVAEAVTRDAKGNPILGPPKSSAGYRTLAMPEGLADMVARHIQRRGASGADPERLLFNTSQGQPLRYSNWRRAVWVPATTSAGCVGAGFHDLRRANATALVGRGVDLKTAQTRLGHSDARLTLQVYADFVDVADADAAELIGDHFLRSGSRRRASG